MRDNATARAAQWGAIGLQSGCDRAGIMASKLGQQPEKQLEKQLENQLEKQPEKQLGEQLENRKVEAKGIEPLFSPCKGDVLPLNEAPGLRRAMRVRPVGTGLTQQFNYSCAGSGAIVSGFTGTWISSR